MGISEDIQAIEEEISKTKYNKATQKHIGELKAKLAKLKVEQEKKRSKSGAGGLSYGLKKQGNATVVLLGFPSVGKSTLLNRITNAESKIGAYDFTTLTVVPGTMKYNTASIQIFDIPGIVHDAATGRGRGKEVLSVVRNSDLVLVVLNGASLAKVKEQRAVLEKELYTAGIRINQQQPDVKITKKNIGGVSIQSASKQLDDNTIKTVLKEFRILNADVLIRDNISIDQFIDCVAKNRAYIPCVFVVNKAELLSEEEKKQLGKDYLFISALKGEVSGLQERMWKELGLVRIYLKKIGKLADKEEPLIMKGEVTVKKVAEKIHKEVLAQFKYARIWGPSARHPGQKLGLEHKLKDTDTVELHF